MSYVHLTTSERVKIETYLELGFSIRKIAGRLGRQPSTISRELKRNPHYDSSHADKHYVERKKKCGARTKFTIEKEFASSKSYERPGPLNRLPDDYSKTKGSRSRPFIVGFIWASSRPILDSSDKKESVRNHVRRVDASTSDCR